MKSWSLNIIFIHIFIASFIVVTAPPPSHPGLSLLPSLQVPSKQIVDTVKLFHLPKQRYVSLKFLAWFLLDLHVQRGVHDSCEDARTALLLYRKYKKLEASDQVSSMLGRLYETGRRYNWQVPES